MDSMFNTLMQMPLFRGVSYHQLSEVLGRHPFHFLKYTDNQTVISAGDLCTHLSTVVSGKVRMVIGSNDNKVRVSQTLEAPEPIAPDFFFGKTTCYPATVTADGTCGIMQIEKNDFIKIINSDSIFLFNYLNMLSMNAQLSTEGVLALTSGDLKKRIAYWIISLTQLNARDITMECRQRDLYSVFGVQRQSLTSALNEMKQAGILDYTPTRIDITDRRLLIDLLES